MKKQVLIVMAHQDDEAAFSTRIAREVNQGNTITCVYLTNGAANGVNSEIRDRESLSVLNRLDVSNDCIHFIGSQHNIPDGELVGYLEQASEILEQTLSGKRFHRIYCMAYEGGHHDHDACHIITVLFAIKAGLLSKTWQMPLYNGFKTRSKLFRVLVPIPIPGRTLTRKLGLREALVHSLSIGRYKSQWKTWLGLLPELLYQRLLRRRETLQSVNLTSVMQRPHSDALLYERLFDFSYQKFRIAADAFLKKHETSIGGIQGLDNSRQIKDL